MTASIWYVTIDCADVPTLATFWSDALGYTVEQPGPYTLLKDPGQRGPSIYLQPVPEPKTTKNRVHLDLSAEDPDAERERLVGNGATMVARHEENGIAWTVLADPEGNEFCLFARPSSAI